MSTDKPKRRSILGDDSALSESQLLPPRPKPSAPPESPPTHPPLSPNPENLSDSSTTPSPPSEGEHHSLPLSMSQSLLLNSPHSGLPTDARTALSALATTLDPPTLKVAIRFHAIGSAPQLKQKVFKISASSKFATVVGFLRKRLYGKGPVEGGNWDGRSRVGGFGGGDAGQGLFCYVNSVFAPGLDEGVGNLWRCFKTDDQLIVGYSITPAFG